MILFLFAASRFRPVSEVAPPFGGGPLPPARRIGEIPRYGGVRGPSVRGREG